MSKIALSPSASGTGTLTIAAPNTNSDATINLPTVTGGDFIVSNASGNVGIGTNSPTRRLEVGLLGAFRLQTGSTTMDCTPTAGATDSFVWNTSANAPYVWSHNGTERMRIDSSGNLLVGKTVTSGTVNGVMLTSDGSLLATSNNDAAELYRKTTDGSFGVMLIKSDVGGTASLKGVAFANGTFAAVSDARMKKNVEDSRSYLQDVMSLRVVKYNWTTDEENTPKELGWIAQEVEQVFPGMVSEMGGSKLLKKEVFLPMLMKCIQELNAKVDAQAAEIAALKGQA